MNNAMENPVPVMPVYSGQIIGAVVKALNLDHGVLKGKTARRFFAGRSVSEYSHAQILRAIGEVLVETGIVPVPPAFGKYGISMPEIIAKAVERESQRWDGLVATMQSHSGRTDNPGPAIVGFLRIVVVDLAVRIFALTRLAGLEPGSAESPFWAQENGGGKLLRALTHRAGLSRDKLATGLEVSDRTVDNWLDGNNRPTPEHIAAIANTLASRIAGVTAQQLAQDIHRQFTFAQLADLIAPLIGREQVIALSSALVRFVRLITDDVNTMNRPPIEEVAGMEYVALQFGAAHESTHTLLQNLALVEPDTGWRRDILDAAVPWEISFQAVGVQSVKPRSAAGLAQDIIDIGYEGMDVAEPAIVARLSAASGNIDYGRAAVGGLTSLVQVMESGIALRRAVVRDFPSSPNAYYQLGSFLGMVGKHTSRRDLVDEGITECKIASGLLPDWDAPAVESGIILANIGAFDEALAELRQAAERLPEATPHLRFATGYALMMLDRPNEALPQFEAVIAARQDYALAYGYAAHCAFALGNTQQGIHYAKTARRLGEPDEYHAWQKRRRK